MGGKKKKGGEDATSFKDKGNKYFKSGDYKQAVENYTKAIELDPNQAVFYSNRAAAYIELDELEKANEDADKSISLDPNYQKGYFRKISAFINMDKMQEALEILEKHKDKCTDNEFEDQRKIIETEIKMDNVLPKDHPEYVKLMTFLDWLKKGGSVADKIKIRFYTANFRGVHAKRRIKKNETFLFTPKSQIITLEMAKATPIGKKMVEAKMKLLSPKHSFLSSFVLQEKRKADSYWKPYLDILPNSCNNFPIFFTAAEKEWLKGSPFLEQVEEKISDMDQDYQSICTAVPEFKEFPQVEFNTFRMLISSRIFGICVDGTKTDALVPYADMLNHRLPRQTTWEYRDSRGGFVIDSNENISRGEQIYDSYGEKCNSRFLLNYGFIVLNNQSNEVALKVWYDPTDPLLSFKKEVLKMTQDFKSFRVSKDTGCKKMSHFFSYMRFVEFQGPLLDLYQLIAKATSNKKKDDDEDAYDSLTIPPISFDNELKVLNRLKKLCTDQIARYPATYEEDLVILERKDLTENQRNSVLMRSGEKLILHELQKLADVCIDYSQIGPKKAKEELGKINIGDGLKKYISEVFIPLLMKNKSQVK